jgi:DNA-binding Xre family transcriptional regulator
MIVCTLKSMLKRRGLTRYGLMKKSGISYPALHALYRNETRSYNRHVLNRLCATLRCQPKDLLCWKSEPHRTPFPRK